jgi:uncharacterized protein (TIGR03435 family)
VVKNVALVLGGVGSAGHAWTIGVIAGLAEAGIDMTEAADLVIGTSSGANAAYINPQCCKYPSAAGERSVADQTETLPLSIAVRKRALDISGHRSRLVAWSYSIDSFRIIGPDWIHSTFYDINAKADGPTPEQDIKAMLKTLLAQRLDLTVHLRTGPVLVVAMAVAKSGLKVHLENVASGAFEMIRDRDSVSLRNATFADLAHFFGADGTRVFDNTGVKGQFNISLNYQPYVDPNDSSTHALATAWQEAASRQIGLRFREERFRVPILMIDRVRRKPTEN